MHAASVAVGQSLHARIRAPLFSIHRRRVVCNAVQSSDVDTVLTAEEVEAFKRQGYFCISSFASEDECLALKNRANELVSDFNPQTVSTFSTRNQAKLDDYFTASASDVSFFFEENAFNEAGQLRQAKALSINKIGHAMHDLDPVFRRFSRSRKMQALFRQLGFVRPTPVQSMYIFKQPKLGGEVVPHQDSAFLYTEPLSTVGVWLAIEDATVENGCLFVLDDSHHDGVASRFVRGPDGVMGFPTGKPSWDTSKMKPIPVKAGTLVLLHGSNVHGSNENTSPNSRHAYSMHVIEGADGVVWQPDNWLQRTPSMPFEPLYDS